MVHFNNMRTLSSSSEHPQLTDLCNNNYYNFQINYTGMLTTKTLALWGEKKRETNTKGKSNYIFLWNHIYRVSIS